jgi:hypothetical protein
MHSPSSSWLHSQYSRDLIVNLNDHNLNFNQDVNKLGQRGDAVAAGLNDVDSQNSNPTERASNVNVRNSESISVNDSSVAHSHTTRPKSITTSVRKLRKKHPGRDEYESVGGYVSEKTAKKKEKSGDGIDAKAKKKKSFIQVINKISNDVQSPSQGYETDGGAVLSSQKSKKAKKKSKTKNPSKETGYDTDGGYQSDNRKSKTRFFKLPTRSSKPDFHVANNAPVPALPHSVEKKRGSVVPLPIAGRFARTSSFSMPSSTTTTTTTEGAETHVDNSFPRLSFQPFPATFDFTSTTSSSSPVSAGPSTFDRAQIAPISDSPSAFNAHLHPRKRDSRLSFVSSLSSGSGSNQHNKLQNLKRLFSHSPPSSMQEHQQHRLRPSVSLSSLKHPNPVISFPITRDPSPTSPNLPLSTRSLHSLSVSPTSTSFRSSVSSLQFKKPFRIKLHHPDLPTQQHSPTQTVSSSPSGRGSPQVFLTTTTLPHLQIPRFAKVRPKNPPTDGFGPRSPLSSDSAALGSTLRPSPISSPISSPILSPGSDNSGGLSPKSRIQAGSKRSSQQTIIPSSDYIVPSPRNSPLKTQNPGPPSPTVLTTYHHHDHIPPRHSPAPNGPLPTPPSSTESGESPTAAGNSSRGSSISSSGNAGQQLPLAVNLRKRMSKMNMRQSLLPSQQSIPVATQPISIGGSGVEKTVVVGLRIEKKNGIIIGPSAADDIPKYQKEKAKEARLADDNRPSSSWIVIGDDTTNLDKKETLEVDEEEDQQEVEEDPEDLYEILDRFQNHDNDIHHHSNVSDEQALERSHSFKAGKFAKEKRDNNARPRPQPSRHHQQYVPAAVIAPDLYGFEDDGKSMGDRTSRWSESVYSRSSSISTGILDEEESEERRNRFVKRVEAMLDAEKKVQQAQAHIIPPLPEIPHAYANIIHRQNGNINENAGHRSDVTPGRSWNKF